jgi:hypothetical protein
MGKVESGTTNSVEKNLSRVRQIKQFLLIKTMLETDEHLENEIISVFNRFTEENSEVAS